MQSESFADVLRSVPLFVSVVTVGRGGAENGLTVSWAAPVSFDPPHFMIAVDKHHYSADFLRSTKNFAVNVLRADQARIAGQFARQSIVGEDKLAGLKLQESQTGAAILADALAWFDCELTSIQEVGDHLVVVGEVVAAAVQGTGDALTTTAAGLRYQKAGPKGA